MAILLEVIPRMGVTPMASGGVTGQPTIIPQSVHNSSPLNITIEHLDLNGGGSFEADMYARKREASVGGHRWP
ncbi:hypothetical protein [Demequina sp. NBRC 110055]|uniref:hypothetical protein n=1 Tax=Demequina sp. NBRC 110055 TaxID=1570344 RepID=UPI000A031E1D|nr:hypothetical protein [Demequina sp. NBRC 110055]